jgi:beta-glucosidase
VTVSFKVKNAGARSGAEIAQVYVSLPPSCGEPPTRPVAWDKVQLASGETKTVTLRLDPHYLSIFNPDKGGWELVPGDYNLLVGGSSRDTPLSDSFRIGPTLATAARLDILAPQRD